MFQTITGKPLCPIAAIAAPENFCCAGKLFGGLVSQTRTPPECAIQREVRAGSREPSWRGREEGLCYGGSPSQTHGARQRFLTEPPARTKAAFSAIPSAAACAPARAIALLPPPAFRLRCGRCARYRACTYEGALDRRAS